MKNEKWNEINNSLCKEWQVFLVLNMGDCPDNCLTNSSRKCPWHFTRNFTWNWTQKLYPKFPLKFPKNHSQNNHEKVPEIFHKDITTEIPKMFKKLPSRFKIDNGIDPENCFGIVPKKSKHNWITGPSECNWLWHSRFQHFKGCQTFDGSRTTQTWN